MAYSTGATSLEQRRWIVVGIALQNVLTPCLRVKIQSEMKPLYQRLVATVGIDKQTYPTHHKAIPPSTLKLNYESINNNAALHKNPRHYDYRVKDEVSLAKLFMKPFMAISMRLIHPLTLLPLLPLFVAQYHSLRRGHLLRTYVQRCAMSGLIVIFPFGPTSNTMIVSISWRPWSKTLPCLQLMN